MVEIRKLMVNSFKRSSARNAAFSALDPVPWTLKQATTPMPPLETPGLSWASLGQSLGVVAPFSGVLLCMRFCLCPTRVCFPSPV